jgi:hypothetical protein
MRILRMKETKRAERDGVRVGVLPSPFGVPVPQPSAERSRQVRVTSIKPKITSQIPGPPARRAFMIVASLRQIATETGHDHDVPWSVR